MPEEDITNETWEDNIKIHLGRTAQFKTTTVLESLWHQVFSVFILFGVDRGLTMGSKSCPTKRLKDPQFQKLTPNLTRILEGKL